jgi:hypothetical protein
MWYNGDDGSRFHHTKRRTRSEAHTSSSTPCIWSCDICGFLYNKDHARKCETCGFKAPVTQFGVRVGGQHLMCSVHSARCVTEPLSLETLHNPSARPHGTAS